MQIGGFQKMTMLDYPGKVACTVFTHGCNLKCPFCHNARLVTQAPELIDEDEIFFYLNKRKGILDGVCVSGGEPLLQPDIFDFLERIKSLGLAVKLDTNGCFPALIDEAIDRGVVDYVAMDIKNCKEKYALTAGKKEIDLSAVTKSVELLLLGGVDYEFRTTVTRELHTPSDFTKIGEWIQGAKRYYIQNFVDSGNLISQGLSPLDTQGLKALLEAVLPYVPTAAIRGE